MPFHLSLIEESGFGRVSGKNKELFDCIVLGVIIGGIGFAVRGSLVPVKETLIATQEILNNFMLLTFWKQCGNGHLLFQYYSITAISAQSQIHKDVEKRFLCELDWPAESTNLNHLR